MSNKLYELIKNSGGSFNKFHWECTGFSGWEFKLSEDTVLSYTYSSRFALNDLPIKDSIAQQIFESEIYPRFKKDQERMAKYQAKIDRQQAKIDVLLHKYKD